jgi:hypothetical protein
VACLLKIRARYGCGGYALVSRRGGGFWVCRGEGAEGAEVIFHLGNVILYFEEENRRRRKLQLGAGQVLFGESLVFFIKPLFYGGANSQFFTDRM